MKNLLVVAVLGLLLGAGAWKLQNPDGTLEDLQSQSMAFGERLRGGVDAVRLAGNDEHGQSALTRLQTLESRLDELDTGANDSPADDLNARLASLVDKIDAGQQTISEQIQSTRDGLSALSLRLDTFSAEQAGETDSDGPSTLPARLDERFKVLEDRLASVDVDTRRLAALSDQLQASRDEISTLQSALQSLTESQQELAARIDQTLDEQAAESLILETVREEIASQLSLGAPTQVPADTTGSSGESNTGSVAESQQAEAAAAATNSDADELAAPETQARDLVTREQVRAQRESGAVEYKIYFDRDSVEISEDATRVLDSFITQEQNRTVGVSIFGFTDSVGPAVYNQHLAQLRAANVRSYLIENGFDADRIKALNGLGEAAAAELVPADADAAQQRVVVLFAAQP